MKTNVHAQLILIVLLPVMLVACVSIYDYVKGRTLDKLLIAGAYFDIIGAVAVFNERQEYLAERPPVFI